MTNKYKETEIRKEDTAWTILIGITVPECPTKGDM